MCVFLRCDMLHRQCDIILPSPLFKLLNQSWSDLLPDHFGGGNKCFLTYLVSCRSEKNQYTCSID